MKCSNCGAEVKDGARFCEVCGQPVAQPTGGGGFSAQSSPAGSAGAAVFEETKKKSKAPVFICLAVILAAVIGVVAFAMPKIKKAMMKPADYMQYVEQKSRDHGSEKVGQYFGLVKKSMDSSGSSRTGTFQIEITEDLKSMIKNYLSSYASMYGIQIPNLSNLNDISLDVATDMEGDASRFGYALKLNGESILTAKMYMDAAAKKIYYQIPELSKAYLDASGSLDSQDAEAVAGMDFMEYMGNLQKGEFLPSAQDAEKIFERYTDILIQSIQNAEKEKDQTCEAEGVSVKADVYTARYEGADAVSLIKELIGTLKGDEEVLSYLEKLGMKKTEVESALEDAIKECENMKGAMTLSDYVSEEEKIIGREIKLFKSDDAKEPEMLLQLMMPKESEKVGFQCYAEYQSEELFKITGKGTLSGDIFNGEFSAESPKLMEQIGQMTSGEVLHIKVSDYDVKKAWSEGTGKFEITVPGIAQLSAFQLVMEASGTVEDFKEKIDINLGGQKLCTVNMTGSRGDELDISAPGSGDTVYDVGNEDDMEKYAEEIDTAGVLNHVKTAAGIDLLPFFGDMLVLPED